MSRKRSNLNSLSPFAPLLQVPPTGGGNQEMVPLAQQGEPTGGGSQHNSDSGSPCLQGEPTGGGCEWHTRSAEETEAVGAQLVPMLEPDTLIWVTGVLGAGKTTLIRGLCRALGIAEPIRSPTFTLVNEYTIRQPPSLAGLPLFHLDLYRIETEAQLRTLGLEELLERGGITVIEWGERLPTLGFDYTPHHCWHLTLTPHPDNTRTITLTL
jgi:tRNA threonylcarbamoyladenosine biosynthesis protein TsaE